jgi:hypothetical protein
VRIVARLAANANELPLAVEGRSPRDVRFDGFGRKPDEWEPARIVERYFRSR